MNFVRLSNFKKFPIFMDFTYVFIRYLESFLHSILLNSVYRILITHLSMMVYDEESY